MAPEEIITFYSVDLIVIECTILVSYKYHYRETYIRLKMRFDNFQERHLKTFVTKWHLTILPSLLHCFLAKIS